MWTGTPYDRWQKRLGVTLFTLGTGGFFAAAALHGNISHEASAVLAWTALSIAIAISSAMALLLIAKKAYVRWAKKNGHAFDNVDY